MPYITITITVNVKLNIFEYSNAGKNVDFNQYMPILRPKPCAQTNLSATSSGMYPTGLID